MLNFKKFSISASSNRAFVWLAYFISFSVFIFISWAVSVSISYPYDGLGSISPTGVINEIIDRSVKGVEQFRKGDVIIRVGDSYWGEALPFYKNYSSGEKVNFTLLRGDELLKRSITLETPPTKEILIRLLPLLVAFVFWGVGFVVLLRKPPDMAADVFFIWCLISAVTLTAGAVSYMTSPAISSVFNILLWFIGPLSVNLHMVFPQAFDEKKRKLLLGILYVVALVGSFPYIATNPFYIHGKYHNRLSGTQNI